MEVKECLDETMLHKLEDLGGKTLVVRMINLFCENSEDKIGKILDAWEEKDFHGIERSAHSLVSSSGNLGAVRMQDLAIQIEHNAAKKDANQFPSQLYELQNSFEQVREQLCELKKGYEA